MIRYAYLWRDEARAGRDEGAKDRPCVIVLAVDDQDGRKVVTVAPVTHRPPDSPGDAVELPKDTKSRLGLDEARSWIVATEINRFVWPGPDIRPARRGAWDYGFVPGGLLRAVREAMAARRALAVLRR